ncbi:unnamed protein product [Clonostachys rosea f. rosea IK726]|jgi:acyl-CoA thioesterase II|uniref:Uncharacterized protein n=1 Tax=Clonostachys rosea f. rosea IK726 TaxID=1349383 RepID=A0ACA9TX55_BIOOC|nr:unnamed protein product [Clonostachys rosea f. rosea IK726]
MAHSIIEQVAVEQLQANEFVSRSKPIRMGNAQPIAYGGSTISVAVSSACATVPAEYALYSVLGHFLGPASTEQKLYCTVQEVRTTRSFATRRVQVKQKQADGSFRPCMELTADFHVSEPSLLEYSAPPAGTYPKPEDCPSYMDYAETLRKKGLVTDDAARGFKQSFGVGSSFFESRLCVNGVSAQNLFGAAKGNVTTQDSLPITSKKSAEWQRSHVPVTTPAQNAAVLSFFMDGALSFLPLSHSHMGLEDAGACSSLDFALRIFVTEVKMDRWHLRERITSRGGNGRTYSEGRLYDESGVLVASMTQQSIMRPLKGASVSRL